MPVAFDTFVYRALGSGSLKGIVTNFCSGRVQCGHPAKAHAFTLGQRCILDAPAGGQEEWSGAR